MGIYVLTSGDHDPLRGSARQVALALIEMALRGGFADQVEGFWPLERLGQVPENATVWVLASSEAARSALERIGGTTAVGRRILYTPRHGFWDRLTEAIPRLEDPRETFTPKPNPFGADSVAETTDWLAVFWSLLQRAEEYASGAPEDAHGRFPPWASALGRQGWLDRPVADEMAQRIARRLREIARTPSNAEGDAETPLDTGWSLVVTHDVDSLRFWSWRRFAHSFRRPDGDNTGTKGLADGEMKSLVRIRIPVQRAVLAPWVPTFRTTFAPQSDPHWSFPWLRKWEQAHAIRPTVFVLPERRTGYELYDLRWAETGRGAGGRLAAQLRRWKEEGAEIGLHPPYDAMECPERLPEQRKRIERVVRAMTVESARYHWLRFQVPAGWNALGHAGILNDATLGYAQQEGFRAGTCHPYATVDLRTAAPTGVVEVPMAAMDTTLRHHRGVPPGPAYGRLAYLARACRQVGGAFVLLWHTNSFDRREWRGWRRVFFRTVEQALEQGAVSRTVAEVAEAHRTARARLIQRLFPGGID